MYRLFINCWFLICYSSFISHSQSFEILPSGEFTRDYFYNDFDYDGLYIYNVSDSPLNIVWYVIDSSFAPECDFQICNSGYCLAGLPEMATMKTIAPSDSGFIFLHVLTGTIIGTSTIKFKIAEQDTPFFSDTMTFTLHVVGPDTTIGVPETLSEFSILVGPTIVSNNIYLNCNNDPLPGYKVEILNTSGKSMLSKEIFERKTIIDVALLPSSLYFVKVTHSSSQLFKVHKILKL